MLSFERALDPVEKWILPAADIFPPGRRPIEARARRQLVSYADHCEFNQAAVRLNMEANEAADSDRLGYSNSTPMVIRWLYPTKSIVWRACLGTSLRAEACRCFPARCWMRA